MRSNLITDEASDQSLSRVEKMADLDLAGAPSIATRRDHLHHPRRDANLVKLEIGEFSCHNHSWRCGSLHVAEVEGLGCVMGTVGKVMALL